MIHLVWCSFSYAPVLWNRCVDCLKAHHITDKFVEIVIFEWILFIQRAKVCWLFLPILLGWQTTKERHMWTCPFHPPIQLYFVIRNTEYSLDFGISRIKIWNYNRSLNVSAVYHMLFVILWGWHLGFVWSFTLICCISSVPPICPTHPILCMEYPFDYPSLEFRDYSTFSCLAAVECTSPTWCV